MAARQLTALLLLAASGAAQNCARPHLGAKSRPVYQNALEKAFDALDDNEDIDVTWNSKRRYAQYLDADTGACDGIEWGGSDDGCYALRPDGAGLDLAGLRAARRGTVKMKSHGYAPREEDVERLPNAGYGWARGPRQKRSGGLTTFFGGGGAQVQPADQPYEAVDVTTLAAVRTAAEAESMIFVVHADMLRLLFTGFLCQKGFEPDEAKIKIVHEFPMIDNFEQHLEGLDLLAPSRIQDMRSLIETLHEQPVGEVLAAYPLGARGDVGLRLGVSGDATRDLTNAEHALVIRAAASSCKALAATDDGKQLYDTTLEHYRLKGHFRSSSSIGSGGSGAVDQCIDVYERTPPSKQGALKRNLLRKLWPNLPELLDDAGKVYTRKGGDARARTKRGFTKLSLWLRAKLRYFAKDADRASNMEALEQLLNDVASVAAKDLKGAQKHIRQLDGTIALLRLLPLDTHQLFPAARGTRYKIQALEAIMIGIVPVLTDCYEPQERYGKTADQLSDVVDELSEVMWLYLYDTTFPPIFNKRGGFQPAKTLSLFTMSQHYPALFRKILETSGKSMGCTNAGVFETFHQTMKRWYSGRTMKGATIPGRMSAHEDTLTGVNAMQYARNVHTNKLEKTILCAEKKQAKTKEPAREALDVAILWAEVVVKCVREGESWEVITTEMDDGRTRSRAQRSAAAWCDGDMRGALSTHGRCIPPPVDGFTCEGEIVYTSLFEDEGVPVVKPFYAELNKHLVGEDDEETQLEPGDIRARDELPLAPVDEVNPDALSAVAKLHRLVASQKSLEDSAAWEVLRQAHESDAVATLFDETDTCGELLRLDRA